MRVVEKVTPLLGAVGALATLACCVPIGGAALLGLGGLLAAVAPLQEWLLPVSGLLVVAGGALMWRSRRICRTTSKASVAIFVVSAAVVLLVLIFPQTVAGLLTDWLS